MTPPVSKPSRRWRLTEPDGTVSYAQVQALRLTPGIVVEGYDFRGYAGTAMMVTLAIRVPKGEFVP